MKFSYLVDELKRRNLSVSQLSVMINISESTLYSRLNGETHFRQKEIVAISKVLDLSNELIRIYFFTDFVS